MYRHLFIFGFFLLSIYGNAQLVSRVNFDQIKVEIEDAESDRFYPKLIERLLAFDSTLQYQDYLHLYYGNVFQEYYHPYGATEKQKLFLESIKQKEVFEKSERLGYEVLQENPVNLEVIIRMLFLYNAEKRIDEARLFSRVYVSFLEVIYSSGTGKSCDDGFVVISVDDEYRITGDLGLNVIRQDLINSCDRLVFSRKGQKRKNRIKELYFNVRMPLTYMSKSFNKSDLPEPDTDPDEDE